MQDDNLSVSISVGIVVYNTDPNLLAACIESIHSQEGSHIADVEIVVHDNSANAQLRSNFQDSVNQWIESANIGFAAASNRCVELAKHEWVLLLNPDARLHSGALESLAELAVDGGLEEKTIYCGWLRSGRDVQVDGMMYWVFSSARLARRGFYRRYLERNEARQLVDVEKVSGGACFAARSTLLDLGPYDARFFLYGEDADMSARARIGGFRLVGVPSAVVWHQAASSQASHSLLVETARADAAVRLSAYRLGRVRSLLFRAEFAIVTLLGLVRPGSTSSKSRDARLARLRVIRHWGLKADSPKWDPSCVT